MYLFICKLAKLSVEESCEFGKQLNEIVSLTLGEMRTLGSNLFRCYLVIFAFKNISETIFENIGIFVRKLIVFVIKDKFFLNNVKILKAAAMNYPSTVGVATHKLTTIISIATAPSAFQKDGVGPIGNLRPRDATGVSLCKVVHGVGKDVDNNMHNTNERAMTKLACERAGKVKKKFFERHESDKNQPDWTSDWCVI